MQFMVKYMLNEEDKPARQKLVPLSSARDWTWLVFSSVGVRAGFACITQAPCLLLQGFYN